MDIISTVGLSKNYDEMISTIVFLRNGGCNYFRFNISKCKNKTEMMEILKLIYKIKFEFNIKIMLDIPFPGSKMRIYLSQPYVDVLKDETILLKSWNNANKSYDFNSVEVNCERIGDLVSKSERIIYSDGVGGFVVKDIIDNKSVLLTTLNDFRMYNNKSIAFSNSIKKEHLDNDILEALILIKPESIALSFMSDIDFINIIKPYFTNSKIVSKIENQEGIDNAFEISKLTDIMIARGDLSLHSNYIKLFDTQKHLSKVAKENGKDLYIATGILDSLNYNYLPSCTDIIDLTHLIHLSPNFIILNAGTSIKRFEFAKNIIKEIKSHYEL